jgi:hypothetical protein
MEPASLHLLTINCIVSHLAGGRPAAPARQARAAGGGGLCGARGSSVQRMVAECMYCVVYVRSGAQGAVKPVQEASEAHKVPARRRPNAMRRRLPGGACRRWSLRLAPLGRHICSTKSAPRLPGPAAGAKPPQVGPRKIESLARTEAPGPLWPPAVGIEPKNRRQAPAAAMQ